MTRRVFYIALGATVGWLVVRRVSGAVEALQPQSVAGSLVQSMQDFLAEARAAMAEREKELRCALGLDGRPELVEA